jgi:maltose alpha-D-glucosyltransferase/alpha-amylase
MLKKVNSYFDQFDKNPKLIFNWIPKKNCLNPVKPTSLAPQTLERLDKEFTKAIVTMGKRTAQMHLAMAKDLGQVSFTPVSFNPDYSVWLKE